MDHRPQLAPPRWLLVASVVLCLAGLAVAVGVVGFVRLLPAALLVVVWWKRGRVSRNDVGATLPFFAIGLTAALHTAAVDVVPDSHGELHAAVVRHLDEPVQRGKVALLLLARDPHHPHVRKSL